MSAHTDAEINKEDCLLLISWLRSGNPEFYPVAELLSKISDLNIADDDGVTPLTAAICLRDIDTVKMILDAKTDKPTDINFVSSKRINGDLAMPDTMIQVAVSYPLKCAIEDDGKDMVEFLIARGAKLDMSARLKGSGLSQPLNVCIEQNHPNSAAIFEMLCRAGADAFCIDEADQSSPFQKCLHAFGGIKKDEYIIGFKDKKEWLRHKLHVMSQYSGFNAYMPVSKVYPNHTDDRSFLSAMVGYREFMAVNDDEAESIAGVLQILFDLGCRVDVPDGAGKTIYKAVCETEEKTGKPHTLKSMVHKRMQDHIAEYLSVKQDIPAPIVSVGQRKQLKLTL